MTIKIKDNLDSAVRRSKVAASAKYHWEVFAESLIFAFLLWFKGAPPHLSIMAVFNFTNVSTTLVFISELRAKWNVWRKTRNMLFIDIYKKQFNDRIKQQDNKDIDIWYCYWWLYLRSGQSGLKEVLSWLTRDNIKRPEPSFQNKKWSAVVIHKTYIHQSFFIGYIVFSPLQHIFLYTKLVDYSPY